MKKWQSNCNSATIVVKQLFIPVAPAQQPKTRLQKKKQQAAKKVLHEHPLSRTTVAETEEWYCDMCQGTTEPRWNCSPCNYDVCNTCYAASKAAGAPDNPLHEHPLCVPESTGEDDDDWYCEICGDATAPRHHCNDCDYDVCHQCFCQHHKQTVKSRPDSFPTELHEHPLNTIEGADDIWFCKFCSEACLPRLYCVTCSTSICGMCAQLHKAQATRKKMEAMYTFAAASATELGFKKGDILTILKDEAGSGWHLAQLGEAKGHVPANYLKECTEEQLARECLPATLLLYPPPEALEEGVILITDRYRRYRGYIAADGTCVNNCNDIIGYIEASSGEAGSIDGDLLGNLRPTMWESEFTVEDAAEDKVGSLDLGRALIRDHNDKIVAEVTNIGEVRGHSLTWLGKFDGFSFRELKLLALYLLLVDPGMLNEVEG